MYSYFWIIGGSVVLAGAYTWIRFNSNNIWAWFDTFTAVVISATIGFSVAGILFVSQENERKSAKIDSYKKSFEIEIIYIKGNFSVQNQSKTRLKSSNKEVDVWMGYMPTAIFEDAARSGLFSDKKSISVYALEAQTKAYNREVDHLRLLAVLSVNATSDYWPQIESVIKKIEINRKIILENCGYLVSGLDLKLDSTLLPPTNGSP